MTDDLTTSLIVKQLARIADALERIAAGGGPVAPDYQRPIEEYASFDWSTINASVVARDNDGPTHIEHGGVIYTRRSPQNKFEPAIWFSKASGRNEDGDVQYLKLITFRTIKGADPLPSKLAGQIHNQPPAAQSNGKQQGGSAPAPAGKISLADANALKTTAGDTYGSLDDETLRKMAKAIGEKIAKAKVEMTDFSDLQRRYDAIGVILNSRPIGK